MIGCRYPYPQSSCSAQLSGGDLVLDAGSGQELLGVPRIRPAAYVVTTWEDRQLSFTERAISASRLPGLW